MLSPSLGIWNLVVWRARSTGMTAINSLCSETICILRNDATSNGGIDAGTGCNQAQNRVHADYDKLLNRSHAELDPFVAVDQRELGAVAEIGDQTVEQADGNQRQSHEDTEEEALLTRYHPAQVSHRDDPEEAGCDVDNQEKYYGSAGLGLAAGVLGDVG